MISTNLYTKLIKTVLKINLKMFKLDIMWVLLALIPALGRWSQENLRDSLGASLTGKAAAELQASESQMEKEASAQGIQV